MPSADGTPFLFAETFVTDPIIHVQQTVTFPITTNIYCDFQLYVPATGAPGFFFTAEMFINGQSCASTTGAYTNDWITVAGGPLASVTTPATVEVRISITNPSQYYISAGIDNIEAYAGLAGGGALPDCNPDN